MAQITPSMARLLLKAAGDPEHRVVSRNSAVLMDMSAAGLMEQGALTEKGLAAARHLQEMGGTA